jgi:hypothetical protein
MASYEYDVVSIIYIAQALKHARHGQVGGHLSRAKALPMPHH